MNVINIMLGITAVNGIPEAIVSGLIITPIVLVVFLVANALGKKVEPDRRNEAPDAGSPSGDATEGVSS